MLLIDPFCSFYPSARVLVTLQVPPSVSPPHSRPGEVLCTQTRPFPVAVDKTDLQPTGVADLGYTWEDDLGGETRDVSYRTGVMQYRTSAQALESGMSLPGRQPSQHCTANAAVALVFLTNDAG